MTPTQPGETDLEALLFQTGDLPAEIAATRADNPVPLNFENQPPAATVAGLRFARDGRGAGSVSALLYNTSAEIDGAFERLTKSVSGDAASSGSPAQPESGLGDKAMRARLSLRSSTYGTGQVAVVVFARCRALVDVRMNEWTGLTIEMALAYAKRLDQRLAVAVCG
jgi:hypothetical protein